MAENARRPYTDGWDSGVLDSHMPERQPERESKPNLRAVANTQQTEIAGRIRALLEALTDIHILDAELRQLWLETHWIKSDHEQGVLAVPTNWELMIFQIHRGNVTATLRRYPQVVQAATDLADSIKSYLKSQVCD